jgi:polysaccharide biosynthesis transport protein
VAASDAGTGSSLSSEMADYCVHHIRTMLQLRSPGQSMVVALTSPSPGAGKTTLSIALGMSFAAAGSRTLLIDCDFVGHGLTSAVRSLVCDRTADVLTAPAGTVEQPGAGGGGPRHMMTKLLAARRLTFDDDQVAELLAATRRRAAAGDAHAARTARALEALERPGDGGPSEVRRGIMGALDGRELDQCVIETDVPNLSMLTVGDGTEEDAKRLSRDCLERLVADCRGRYDTVLIDTGPVIGSIEAAFASAAADDVLLVVARGERRPAVDEALERIATIGAEVAGVVFNRATSADVAMSSYGSRSQSKAAQVA